MSGRRSLHDLNGNGIPDKLEKNHGLSDLNGNGVDDKFERKGRDLNRNGIPDSLEGRTTFSSDLNRNGIPDSLERRTTFSNDLNGNGIPDQFERLNVGTKNYTQVVLPTKIIEKPAAIHEEIRREQVEEIQPIVNVEKIKTEVHQVTQPLIDREVRAVGVQERMLPTQVLPQINQPTVALRSAEDVSTVSYRQDTNLVVEKPAMYMETQKKQIIEEIQPVIYKETIVPTLIKETKPIYQTIVEGTTYVHEVLPAVQLKTSNWATRINATDLNGNGIPDQFERGTSWKSNDLNGNGIPDQFERGTSWKSTDLNRNGIPDSLERQSSGFSGADLNRNGIPDKFEQQTTTNTPYAPVQTL